MPDGGHHGESQHDERGVAMPSMPGAGLVMIKAKLVFCRLEAVLDGPAAAFHAHQFSIEVPSGAQVEKKAKS